MTRTMWSADEHGEKPRFIFKRVQELPRLNFESSKAAAVDRNMRVTLYYVRQASWCVPRSMSSFLWSCVVIDVRFDVIVRDACQITSQRKPSLFNP